MGVAAGRRLSELGEWLIDLGWQVEALTALPNYPTGKVFDDYDSAASRWSSRSVGHSDGAGAAVHGEDWVHEAATLVLVVRRHRPVKLGSRLLVENPICCSSNRRRCLSVTQPGILYRGVGIARSCSM